MKNHLWKAAAVAGVASMAGIAQAGPQTPTAKDLTPAVQSFLADHGDLCLAWYTWPRELTAQAQQTGVNEAVQLPVLKRLGIVQSALLGTPTATRTAAMAIGAASSAPASAQLSAPGPTLSYSLTDKGQRYYLQKKRETLNVHGQKEEHDGDFCVAQLTLDKVVKWPEPDTVGDHLETIVRYTYHVKAADWMSDPDAQRVFPVVARIIHGAGTLEMTVTLKLEGDKWVPVMPGQ